MISSGSIVVERKRISKILEAIFLILFSSLYLYGIIFLYPDKGIIAWIFAIILVCLFIFFFFKSFNAIQRALSEGEEFEITPKELIVFDNPSFTYQNKIPYNEMLEVSLARLPKTVTYLVISLNPNAKLRGNGESFNSLHQMLFESGSKKIFLTLEFADINYDELVRIINRKIQECKAAESIKTNSK